MGVLFNALVFVVGPALLGYPDLRQGYPGLALVLDAVLFTLPMAAWMRIRGMAWRPTLEMSGATVGLAIVVALLTWIIPAGVYKLDKNGNPWLDPHHREIWQYAADLAREVLGLPSRFRQIPIREHARQVRRKEDEKISGGSEHAPLHHRLQQPRAEVPRGR